MKPNAETTIRQNANILFCRTLACLPASPASLPYGTHLTPQGYLLAANICLCVVFKVKDAVYFFLSCFFCLGPVLTQC